MEWLGDLFKITSLPNGIYESPSVVLQVAIHRGAKTKSDSAQPNKENFLCSATFQEQSALLESAQHVDDGIFVVMLTLRAHLSHKISRQGPPPGRV
jgi:hypothetical protein